jgi:O-antigen biosynthesis protein WbqP
MSSTKRTFDVLLALSCLVVSSPLFLIVALAVKFTSKGPVLHWSTRVGRHNELFRMPKFRSMRLDTPQMATHLLSDPSRYLTPIGGFLRKTSLDEFPQLLSVLAGRMSFVGPRPALFNQDDLISVRTERGIHRLVPGLTGWAQVNGRDELPIPVKAQFDYEYLQRRSFKFDLQIICTTVVKVVRGEGIRH